MRVRTALAALVGLTVDTAVCQMFGRVPPSGPAVARVSPMGRDFASATR
jgi:hypothetical protein